MSVKIVNKTNRIENLMNGLIKDVDVIKLLRLSNPDIEEDITGVYNEINGTHIYAYIDNKTLELCDCIISIDEVVIEPSIINKTLIHNWLIREFNKSRNFTTNNI